MGDSRSWAAEKEDEITVCKYGHKSRYFDKCSCEGCLADRKAYADAMEAGRQFGHELGMKLSTMEPSRRKQVSERFLKMLQDLH